MSNNHDEMIGDKAHQLSGRYLLLLLVEEDSLENKESKPVIIFNFGTLLGIDRILYGEWMKIKLSDHHVEFGLSRFRQAKPNESTLIAGQFHQLRDVSWAFCPATVLVERDIDNHA